MRPSLRLVWGLLAAAVGAVVLSDRPLALPSAGAPGTLSAPPVLSAAPAPPGAPGEASSTGAETAGAVPVEALEVAASGSTDAGGAESVQSGREGGLLAALAPVRVARPAVPPGPRRIGLQAGHWKTADVPEELRRLEHSTGTAGGGVMEWQLNLDVANRVAAILRARGYQVDVLPTTVPRGYLADVFLALHADGSNDPSARGFKAAHGNRRGPYEGQLVRAVAEEYGRATGLPVDPQISRNMRGYYAFSWSRLEHAVAPHTPAAILELGFMTNAADRALLLGRTETVADAVAHGVQRFLDEVPAGAAFAEDLILPPALPPRPAPTPTPR